LRVSIEGGGTDWGQSQLFSAYNQASGKHGLYLMIRFTGSFQKNHIFILYIYQEKYH
jgi:hypothetical protein